MGFLSGLFGGSDKEDMRPTFYEDPYYKKTQDFLFPYATSILEGKPNDYYGEIGNWGGKSLEDMIGLTTRDTANAVNSSMVRSGLSRSGIAPEIMASKTADVSKQYRWADFNRAMAGRQYLLGAGLGAMSGVRGGALENQSQNNAWNMGMYKMDMEDAANENNMWAQLISSGIGAMGGLAGISMLRDGGGGMGGGNVAQSSMVYGGSDLGTSDWNDLLGQLSIAG